MGVQGTGLDRLFSPVTSAEFFEQFWQKQTLVQDFGPRARFADLIRRGDVDDLVSTLVSTEGGWLMLTRQGKPLPTSTLLNQDGFVHLPAVYAAYEAGHTIILTMLQKRWPAIGTLCRALEADLANQGVLLSRPLGANLYLTPAGAQGFQPHYDYHDVFVLQLEGEKAWRIYDSLEPFPVDKQTAPVPEDQLPPLTRSLDLRPGQALYIPRGVFHEAATQRGASLHLTLSIHPYTWIDLVQRLLPRVDGLREALPLLPPVSGEAEGSEAGFQRRFEDHVRALLERRDALEEARRMAARFLERMDPLPDDGFHQIDQLEGIDPTTRVRHRRGALARLETTEGRTSLRFPGSGFGGPEQIAEVFRFILETPRFLVADLPDFLDAESKTEIVRQLVREGLLNIEAPDV